MDKRLKTNLAKWNAVVPVHANSKMYDLPSFKAGRISLHDLELAEVGDVRGKSLLHLQCHFGSARRSPVSTSPTRPLS